jgi:hypothetical protein
MADLTLRAIKGSPLTNAELDGNFEYFTGSHAVTGSLTITEDLIVSGNIIGNISGSVLVTTNAGVQITGSLIVSGSANSVFDIDLFDLQITGGLDVSRDVTVGDDLTVEDETTLKKETTIGYKDFSNYDFSYQLKKETTIGYKDFSNYDFSYQLNVTASSNSDKSARFDGGIEVTGSSILVGLPTSEPNVTGSLWISGSSAAHPNSGYLMIFNP